MSYLAVGCCFFFRRGGGGREREREDGSKGPGYRMEGGGSSEEERSFGTEGECDCCVFPPCSVGSMVAQFFRIVLLIERTFMYYDELLRIIIIINRATVLFELLFDLLSYCYLLVSGL